LSEKNLNAVFRHLFGVFSRNWESAGPSLAAKAKQYATYKFKQADENADNILTRDEAVSALHVDPYEENSIIDDEMTNLFNDLNTHNDEFIQSLLVQTENDELWTLMEGYLSHTAASPETIRKRTALAEKLHWE